MSANDSVPRFDRTARRPRGGGSGGGRRARTSLRVFPPFFLRRLPPPSAPPPRHVKQLMAVRSAPDVVTKVDVLTDGSRLRERRDAGSHRARGLTVSLLVRTCGGCRGSRPRIVVVVFAPFHGSRIWRPGGSEAAHRSCIRTPRPRSATMGDSEVRALPPPRRRPPLISLPLPSSRVFFVSSADLRRPSSFLASLLPPPRPPLPAPRIAN